MKIEMGWRVERSFQGHPKHWKIAELVAFLSEGDKA
jgi:hypothetical protein